MDMTYFKRLEPLTLALVIIAGLNWAIVALFDTNVISDVLGGGTLTDVAYVVVGVAALTFVPRLLEELHLGGRMHAHGH
jgi:uncharacterized membrane protein YuzA (DUF378 family)